MCKRRILSGLLSLFLLFFAALPVSAEQAEETAAIPYSIASTEQFLLFAQQCRLDSFSQNLEVVLETDIDLTGSDFTSIPIFSGTFEGNGHTIQGVDITNDGSAQGLFRYLTETAVIQNLIVEGTIQPSGTGHEVGGIAGNNAGRIVNCSFRGTVSGNEYIGGIAGVNGLTGIIENCDVDGSIYGSHFVGGMAGKNSGVLRNCENTAQVNTTAQQNNVELSDITIESLTSSESVNTVTDIGGIAGSSTGVIRECVNRGNVGYQQMGYNIGGIAGTQSGYLADCRNYGEVHGRKEVGGIVGQMEPTTLVEYEEDALQILRRQLEGLGGIVNSTASNVQGGAEAIYGQVTTLRDHVTSAKEAVETLLPSEDDFFPDMDTIQAAQNSLSSSMSGMNETLRGMNAVTDSMMGKLSNNLYAIQTQMNAMRTTLGNASETMGGSITDVSDADSEEDLTGKVENCVNYGRVLADLNGGGIAGAMAVENDLDHEEDFQIIGDNSLNFSSELRCVIRNCSNEAVVTVKKQNAGGITGWQSLGLVKNSYNSGNLDAAGAEYVGGITGLSTGFIRSCGAKGEISGARNVGGIAGSATIATDCLSMVKLSGGKEKTGAILGVREEGFTDTENPIAGNLYFSVTEDLGGIDGISYAGMAESMQRQEFLELENLPQMFQNVTLCFRYENGGEKRFHLTPGSAFPADQIPPVPEKNGHTAVWEGLSDADLSCVTFDMTFFASYSSYDMVMESETRRNEMPLLLVQGSFTPEAQLMLAQWEEAVPVEENETFLEAWSFTVSQGEDVAALRICLPEGSDPNHLRVLLCDEQGAWRTAEHKVDGSYAAVALESGDQAIALIQTANYLWMILAAAGTLVLVLVIWLVIRKRRKKRKPETVIASEKASS